MEDGGRGGGRKIEREGGRERQDREEEVQESRHGGVGERAGEIDAPNSLLRQVNCNTFTEGICGMT